MSSFRDAMLSAFMVKPRGRGHEYTGVVLPAM